MAEEPGFRTRIQEVSVGALTFRLRLIESLDEAIDYYVETAADDAEQIPYYTQLWDAALALAAHMAERPDAWPGRRVLELGCGLGLPSLVAARLGANVLATDFHRHNGAFLRENARLNGLSDIDYACMDWRRPTVSGEFDVLLGSDLIYEGTMIDPLVHCVARYCAPGGCFLFADPGRANLQSACSALEAAGFVGDLTPHGDIYVFTYRRGEA